MILSQASGWYALVLKEGTEIPILQPMKLISL